LILAQYRLSQKAEMDLAEIIAYTFSTWGRQQADRYSAELRDCCRVLAQTPTIGRRCEWSSRNLRRMEQGSHVIYYRKTAEGILVLRILHQNMLPERHRMQDK
jgi:toxin ParE1/3/4